MNHICGPSGSNRRRSTGIGATLTTAIGLALTGLLPVALPASAGVPQQAATPTAAPTVEATVEPTASPTEPVSPTAAPRPMGAILGLVFNDRDRNGLVAPDEPGVPNVGVRLEGESISLFQVTGAAGTFAFGDLAPGAYDVTIDVPPGMRLSTTDRYSGVTVDGETITGLDFGLASSETATASPPTAEPEAVDDTVAADDATMAEGDEGAADNEDMTAASDVAADREAAAGEVVIGPATVTAAQTALAAAAGPPAQTVQVATPIAPVASPTVVPAAGAEVPAPDMPQAGAFGVSTAQLLAGLAVLVALLALVGQRIDPSRNGRA